MMDIISKGDYKHYQIDNFISVKQYIFIRSDGQKCLTMRYTNSLGHNVNGFKFFLIQLDLKGNVISRKKIRINNIVFPSDSDYTSNKGIIVDERCVDFKVQMLCVYSDRYRYKLKNDRVAVYYVPHKKWSYEDDKIREKNIKAASKTRVRTPSVRFVASVVIIAMIILALSPIITYFTNRIATNAKRLFKRYLEIKAAQRAAAKAAATAVPEESSILEDVTYEEQD